MRINILTDSVKKRDAQKLVKAIFEAEWYVARYSDVREQVAIYKTTPLKHYLEHGIQEGRSPNVLFDFSYYKNRNADHLRGRFSKNSEIVIDYLSNSFAFKNSPHPLFDPEWYLDHYNDLKDIFQKNKLHPYIHFLKHGAKEGRAPNALFDTQWYLENYPEARELVNSGTLTAVQHYLSTGAKRGFSPSPLFDARWYLDNNQDVAALTREGLTDALSHYLSLGQAEGRSYRAHGTSVTLRNSPSSSAPVTSHAYSGSANNARRYYGLSNVPLVSIIIVNLDGEHHLADLAASLNQQSYRNFEIIFVDNGSQDASKDLWKTLVPNSRVVALGENVGFAKANNIGLTHSKGELIAVLNNDTRVDHDWLYSLVNTMRRDPDIGAVTSKIRFWTKFVTIDFVSVAGFSLDAKTILERMVYKKYFVDIGSETGGLITAINRGDVFEVSLKIPSDAMGLEICLLGTMETQPIKIKSGYCKLNIKIDTEGHYIDLASLNHNFAAAKYVINNAGSIEGPNHTTSDRGFGSYDEGQFETAEPISLICGCACLIRRDALRGRDIFISEFFAYFEDSELSQRLRSAGFQIYYCPSSKVYHKHSSTSIEKSTFWMKFVNRNQTLYQYILSPAEDRETVLRSKLLTFNHHRYYFSDVSNIKTPDDAAYARALDDIISELPLLAAKINDGKLPGKNGIRIGVYNDFWQTLGGGEAHALSIVSALCQISTVEMISRNDFDIDSVLSYFGIEQHNIRKRIVLDMNPDITAEYDVFVNSTYMSECKSLAKRSFYLVSFPSKTPTLEFFASYIFLANSEYTSRWMANMWGGKNFASKILYPAVSDKLVTTSDKKSFRKSKTIISVGRFFASGHSKNQHIITEIFKSCVGESSLQDWELILIGSANDDKYVQRVAQSLAGYNARILTDVPLVTLRGYYQSASVYIHAAGYGQDINKDPENFEHFGMTVVEAAMNGCLPIVYNQAGPKEIVEKLGIGDAYDTINQAAEILRRRLVELEDVQSRHALADAVSARARSLFQTSSSEERVEIISSVFDFADIRSL